MLGRIVTDVAIVAVLGVGAYKTKALDWRGTVSAALLGLAVLELGGVYPFLALLTFVVLGVLATKYRYEEKKRRGVAQSNGGVRSWGNVLGNGLAVVLFLVIEKLTMMDTFWAGTFSAIATVNGDTLASELGKVFGKRPRLITNLRPVKPGVNGGVSLAGELFALIGSLVIALFALPLTEYKGQMLLAVVTGGFIGVNLDSLIGATLENWGVTDNNSTNFLASLLGGLAGAGLFYLLLQ
ncbi:membrane protein [Thermococcus eurythermalis]|uniref:Membrane protein n=1 Tax=Thermococcus eurythermalis TaxID=1505907 RepID=A0A097QVS0_9EURY|nr:DUF92 domain-containing protein [Thermococcus eurythermalis]AIU70574.1 membrane protein [Thermococcus eurythermalis]